MSNKNIFNILTSRELDVLQILWNSEVPLVASEIAKKQSDLTINTVQSILRKLLQKKYIEISDIVYSGNVLSRSYRTIVSSHDFALNQLLDNFQKVDLPATSLIATLLEQEPISETELDYLDMLIQNTKKKLNNQ